MKDWREERISGKRVDLDPRKPGVQSDPDGHTGPTDRGEVEPEEDQFNRGEHGERRREAGKGYRASQDATRGGPRAPPPGFPRVRRAVLAGRRPDAACG